MTTHTSRGTHRDQPSEFFGEGYRVFTTEKPDVAQRRRQRERTIITFGRAYLVEGKTLTDASRIAGITRFAARYILLKIAPDLYAQRKKVRRKRITYAELLARKRVENGAYRARHRERLAREERERRATDSAHRARRCATWRKSRARRAA